MASSTAPGHQRPVVDVTITTATAVTTPIGTVEVSLRILRYRGSGRCQAASGGANNGSVAGGV